MLRHSLIFATIASVALLGFSCKNKYATVNVNVNAAAQAITNAASSVNKSVVTKDAAILEAKAIYIKKESEGTDFSNGPCLSNALLPDWVADIAHSPRQAVDDKAENQCTAFRSGLAHHFVELNVDGTLIRAQ